MGDYVYELMAKIGLDTKEFDEGLTSSGNEMKSWGSKALKTAAKAGAAAIAAVSAAAVKIGKEAIDSYAEYEQLVGGIETLYTDIEGGTQAVDAMMQHASEAWKTAGVSANEYMSMAVESSAAMISSLGGDVDRAAELMDQAIIDMSDNVNKMGTSMEAVQNAYRGFSRGNFTMLDNLALGYAGTKEGMQQLLDKAKELSAAQGELRDFSIDSYADIVDAIHLVQDEMGITGTTAREASTTIQGSLNAMKAAWQNLLTGIADENADFDKLVDDFIDSVVTAAQNIIPRIQTILNGLAKLLTEAADKLLPIIIDTIIQNLPLLIECGVKLLAALVTGLVSAIPDLIRAIPDIIQAIIDGLKAAWPDLQEAGIEAGKAILVGLVSLTDAFWTAVFDIVKGAKDKAAEGATWIARVLMEGATSLANGLQRMTDSFTKWLEQGVDDMSDWLDEAKQKLGDWFQEHIEKIRKWLDNIWQRATDFYDKTVTKTKEVMQWLYDHTIGKVIEIKDGIVLRIQQFIDYMDNFISEAKGWGRELIYNFADGIAEAFPLLAKAANGIATLIGKFIHFSEPEEGPLSNFHTFAPDMMALFAKGIKDNEHLVRNQLASSFDFSDMIMDANITGAPGAGAAAAAGNGQTIYNITVNGIEQLEDIIRWYESRQVIARMGMA